MIKALFHAAIVMTMLTASMTSWAITKTTSIKWYGGMLAGVVAGTCSSTMPDNKPLQVARTLVVDNHLPVGSTLFSWDFDTFLPGYHVRCSGGNSANLDKRTTRSDSPGVIFSSDVLERLLIGFSGATTSSPGIFKTSIDGIGIKLFIKSDYDPVSNNGTTVENTQGYNPPVQHMPKDVIYQIGAGINNLSDSYIQFHRMGSFYLFPRATMNAGMSIKAELVKTGEIKNYGQLSIAGSPQIYSNYSSWPTDALTGNAITVVAPACRLKTQHYSINMGSTESSYTGAPVYGNDEPVQINVECSGKVDHVQFRFSDSGSSPSTLVNKNITLYNSSGSKIDGLEIEMKHNGNRVNIDGTTLTNTGSQGGIRTDPSSLPVYNSTEQVNFTANYVQTAPIKMGGAHFVGGLTGKVNMWLTYN